MPSKFHWNDWGKTTETRESVYQRAKKRLSDVHQEDSVEVQGSQDNSMMAAVVVGKDHDYTVHPSPGKLDWAGQKLKELELKVLTPECELKLLTLEKQRPLIFFVSQMRTFGIFVNLVQKRSSLLSGTQYILQPPD